MMWVRVAVLLFIVFVSSDGHSLLVYLDRPSSFLAPFELASVD